MAESRRAMRAAALTGESITPPDLFVLEFVRYLQSQIGFTRFVPARNLVHYQGADSAPDKLQVSEGDTPLVRIVPADWQFNDHASSSTAILVQNFAVEIDSADRRARMLSPVKWAVLCAVADWNIRDDSPALASFVTRVGPCQGNDARTLGVESDGETLGLKGWSTIISVPVEMAFRRGQMANGWAVPT
jgi:hypothetical protein